MNAKPKILLTGGRGMVGRNILEHPAAEQFSFLVPTSSELDLRDFARVEDYVATHAPDYVIHSAALVGGIQANIARPVDFLVENVDLGRNVILASRNAGVMKLLNLSSSCIYPRNARNPLTEDMILHGELEPTNEGYALAKIFAMRLCEYLNKENPALMYKTLIPCNLYGRFDKFDPKNSHLIPAIIHKVHQAKIENKESVEIWGDGTARREFMYTGDLADTVVRAINNFEALPSYMNVGLGHDFTINEYYQAVAGVIGYKGDFVHDLTKPVGMVRKLVSVDRQQAWGWSAKNNLVAGLEKTYDFYIKEYLK